MATPAIEALRETNPQAVAKWEAQRIMNAQHRERKRRRERQAEPIVSERTPMYRLLPAKASIDDMLVVGKSVLERERSDGANGTGERRERRRKRQGKLRGKSPR